MKAIEIPYFRSIIEREVIFIRKELLGLDRKDWTNVPVYKKYRFCNVHRCYDKTFKLIDKLDKWFEHGLHPGLRTVLRWSASNDLLEYIFTQIHNDNQDFIVKLFGANEGSPEPLFRLLIKAYEEGKTKLVTGSFIVKRDGKDLEEMLNYYKAGTDFYKEFVDKFYENGIQRKSKDAVKFFKDHAMWCADFGAYCIVSDWLYLEPNLWSDKYTWTAYGPGAFNGINLIISTTKTNYLQHLSLLRDEWVKYANEILTEILNEVGMNVNHVDNLCVSKGYLPMSKLIVEPLMLDIEHWLCEYAKYMRGYARKKYKE